MLRGIASRYFGIEKFNVSFENLFTNGFSKLFALGMDIAGNDIHICSLDWFFKDVECYDFTDKPCLNSEFRLETNKDICKNLYQFGSKKYSTENTRDIFNYNTEMEVSPPLSITSGKFDMRTDVVIDSNKIQELVADSSTATNNSDDDIILIDTIFRESYTDNSAITNCEHAIDTDGKLVLISTTADFDLLPLKVNDRINITSPINIGAYYILEISPTRVKLDKTSGIETGIKNTFIEFTVSDVYKNRSGLAEEGFINFKGNKINKFDEESAVNIIHNPKFQMYRWYSYFGSSLVKKQDTEALVVNSYKNNDNVSVECNASMIADEPAGLIKLSEKTSIAELNDYRKPLFTDEMVSVEIMEVMFYEFFDFYNRWRYGDTLYRDNRGYVKVNTPLGVKNIYLYGSEAIEYDRYNNTLLLNGYIKND